MCNDKIVFFTRGYQTQVLILVYIFTDEGLIWPIRLSEEKNVCQFFQHENIFENIKMPTCYIMLNNYVVKVSRGKVIISCTTST